MNRLLFLYKRILRDWPHLLAIWSSVEIVLKFHKIVPPDYQGFVIAVGGIIGILTGKHYWDTKSDKVEKSEGDQK